MKSKEELILRLFFDNPAREWHFEEILRTAKITRSKADGWLKHFIKTGLIKRVKTKSKMPYYISECESPHYKNKKRIYALNMLYDCGFLNHLSSLPKAEAVILFGSFARSDWYSGSDIDIFIYGDAKGLKIAEYELRLHREIQVFICRNAAELNKFSAGMVKNIIKGNLIKGDLGFVKVDINA